MIRHGILVLLSLLLALPAAARREKLALRADSLELPGAPASVVAADVNGDGLRDLAVVIAFTIRGLRVADLDGDGPNEAILTDSAGTGRDVVMVARFR